MQRVSYKLTKLIAINWGETFPFWYVCEYPKSGGTWLSHMLSDYLGVPHPRFSALPLAHQCIIHGHWKFHPKLKRCFYLYRDGRDVMISFYFMRMRNAAKPISSYDKRLQKRYEKLYGRGFDPDDIQNNLAKFIELEMTHPIQARVNWPDHIRQWMIPERDTVAPLSYESLLSEPVDTLTRVLEKFLDEPIDRARVAESVDRHHFDRLAGGRARGTEDRSAFLRKGVAGDWRNHFTKDSAEVFDQYAGEVLVHLGYESDRSWTTM